MRYFIASSIAVLALAAPAQANGPIRPDAAAAQVVRPQMRPKAPVMRRPVRSYRHHSALYAFYPPTVMRDGRSYFYYPRPWRVQAEGRIDQLAEPIEEPRQRYRSLRLVR